MKKFLVATITSIMLLIGIVVGSIYYEKYKIEHIVKSDKAKTAIENMLKKMENKALTPEGKIKSYKIDYNKVKKNPMGGIYILLIINDDPEMIFDTTLNAPEIAFDIVSLMPFQTFDTTPLISLNTPVIAPFIAPKTLLILFTIPSHIFDSKVSIPFQIELKSVPIACSAMNMICLISPSAVLISVFICSQTAATIVLMPSHTPSQSPFIKLVTA